MRRSHGTSLPSYTVKRALLPPETRPLVELEQAEHAAELCTHGTLVWGEIIIKVDLS